MGRHQGRVAFVGGAAGGMGLQICADLLAEGALVIGTDVAEEPALFSEHADRAGYLRGDLTVESFVASAIQEAVRRFGALNYVVNAAGVLWFDRDRSLLDIEEEVWDRVLAINLKSALWACRHAVPHLRAAGGGSIVHISSVDALGGDSAPQEAYGASKAAMLRLSKSVAVQFAQDKIRSNVVMPGSTRTPMQARFDQNPDMVKAIEDYVPLGRLGTARDQSAACLFLLSDEASYITGVELPVDGGILALV